MGSEWLLCGVGGSAVSSGFLFLDAHFRASGLPQVATTSDQPQGRHFPGKLLFGFAFPVGDGRNGDVAADRSRKPNTTRTREKQPARRTRISCRGATKNVANEPWDGFVDWEQREDL